MTGISRGFPLRGSQYIPYEAKRSEPPSVPSLQQEGSSYSGDQSKPRKILRIENSSSDEGNGAKISTTAKIILTPADKQSGCEQPEPKDLTPETLAIQAAFNLKEGTVELSGGVYTGALKELQPHGAGTYTGTDGSSYEGEWVEGKKHGHGIYISSKGDLYDGEWKNGCIHGKGVINYASDDSYEGELSEGQLHGQGIFRFKYGLTLEGEWRHNKKHGKFLMTSSEGSVVSLKYEEDKFVPGSIRVLKYSKRLLEKMNYQLTLTQMMKNS